MQHDWIKSSLGHGETMCSRCKVTNREAAVVGMTECDVPVPAPINENIPPDYFVYYDDSDDDDGEELEDDFDCGLGRDGQCTKAGSEDCDWNCPNRESDLFAGSKANLARTGSGK